MITKDQLTRYIEAKRRLHKRSRALYESGMDIINFEDLYWEASEPLLEACFNKAQLETLEWWLYDCPKGIEGDPTGEDVQMWDKDKNPIYTRNVEVSIITTI